MGKLLSIARKGAKRAPVEEITRASVSEAAGIDGDHRGASPGRQVAIVSLESWRAACFELGTELPWTARRANLLIEGIELAETEGTRITVGGVILEVADETTPCQRMDEEFAGLRKALGPEWRGGVLCTVVQGGDIAVGDTVSVSR